jgi:hypothetical protein
MKKYSGIPERIEAATPIRQARLLHVKALKELTP